MSPLIDLDIRQRMIDETAFKIYAAQSISEMTVNDTEYLGGKYMESFENWIRDNYPDHYVRLSNKNKFEYEFTSEIMLTNRRIGIKLLAEYIASDNFRYMAFNRQFSTKLEPYWTKKYGDEDLNSEREYLRKCFEQFW